MDNTPEVVVRIEKYDSLSNIQTKKYEAPDKDKYGSYTYHHLIGQTVMYLGEPYSAYDALSLKKGAYYKITNIRPVDYGRGIHDGLELTNLEDNTTVYTGGISAGKRYNYQLVVVGHYEKLKEMYVGRKFIYEGKIANMAGYAKADNLISVSKDTVTRNISKETIWECIDVQVKPRKKDDGMSGDYRSPIVLVMNNDKYGQHYCYTEDKFGKEFSGYNWELPIVGPCFRDKELMDAYKKAEEEAKQKHWNDMIQKYGNTYGALIAQGKVRIGMTKDMCKDSWGTPDDINKTTGSWGVHEQWVYDSGSYLYFENGVLTSIQN